jgi:DNA-3-methyladenine glycosylase
MRRRRGLEAERALCSGPGKLTQALGIGLQLNGTDLEHGAITVRPRPPAWRQVDISVDRRIGINKAVELPWRFCVTGSRFISAPVRLSVAGGAAGRGATADAAAARAAAS